MKTLLFSLLTFPASILAQNIVKNKTYTYNKKPDEAGQLCSTQYIFQDSTGYWMSGCENHTWFIGKFIYTSDSNHLHLDFVPFNIYTPVLFIKKRVIPNKKDVTVIVHGIGNSTWAPDISVIKLSKKKSKIINRYYNHNQRGIISFPETKGKKIFWTLTGLYPIFEAELHFFFGNSNYYEIEIDLPAWFILETDGKIWVDGKLTIDILDNMTLKLGGDEYRCD